MRLHNGILAAVAVAVLSASGANAQFNAYSLTPPRVGNQSFVGSLGLNFDANATIEVTRLGFFDSGQNGILGVNQTLFTAIFDRNNFAAPLAVLSFSSADPGVLDGAYRFKTLGTSLVLPVGQYQVTSWGYSDFNRNGNAGIGGGFPSPNTDNGGGLVTYGNSQFSIVPGVFAVTDDGLPDPRYGAGNFTFQRFAPPPPQGGAPEPGTFALLGVGAVAMAGIIRRKRS